MNRTKIEWCDRTWNPVTGCLHGCEYCYARGLANRFKGGGYGKERGMFIAPYKPDVFKPPYVLDEQQLAATKDGWYREAPYPFGFEPTFHRYRLGEPKRLKEPQNIFVVSMGDIFGSWVPTKWIIDVIDSCLAAPQHRYLFLTKNPARYKDLQRMAILPQTDNFWYGTTLTNNDDFSRRGYQLYDAFAGTGCKTFLSIEPLQERLYEKNTMNVQYVDWVIVGAESGNRKGKATPELLWIVDIAKCCSECRVPMFMKDSIIPIVGELLMWRQWPEELKKGVDAR